VQAAAFFSELQIDHFVMAITSFEARVRHITPHEIELKMSNLTSFIVLAGLLFFPGPAPANEAEPIAALCARRNPQAQTVRDTAAATGIKESTLRQLLLKGWPRGIRCGG
jgi:hypothetical protein